MTLSQDAVAGLVKEAERAKAYAGWFAEQYMAVPAADMMMFATALEQQAARIAELEAALKEAIDCVREWHNLPYTRQEASKQWDIYWRNSPEMARLRAALSAKEQ